MARAPGVDPGGLPGHRLQQAPQAGPAQAQHRRGGDGRSRWGHRTGSPDSRGPQEKQQQMLDIEMIERMDQIVDEIMMAPDDLERITEYYQARYSSDPNSQPTLAFIVQGGKGHDYFRKRLSRIKEQRKATQSTLQESGGESMDKGRQHARAGPPLRDPGPPLPPPRKAPPQRGNSSNTAQGAYSSLSQGSLPPSAWLPASRTQEPGVAPRKLIIPVRHSTTSIPQGKRARHQHDAPPRPEVFVQPVSTRPPTPSAAGLPPRAAEVDDFLFPAPVSGRGADPGGEGDKMGGHYNPGGAPAPPAPLLTPPPVTRRGGGRAPSPVEFFEV
eukprot:TRINITY_DN68095_c0_g1_i1.p1 TRINITY_DN68095_c0_g1~~TRINITY_DN68095_c0_g1_i1.p1  ORF type:complete len:328 (+),score=6.10 TRINITY_DN68095_c0_g1_i1:68-1051(+)